MKDKIYLALLHSLWISHKKFHIIFEENLLSDNNSEDKFKNFYNKLTDSILKDFWFNDKEIRNIFLRKEKIKISEIEKMLLTRKVEIIIVDEKKYPESLRNIPNSPYLLYVRWKICDWPKMAVVGSRNITSYWKKVIEKIVPEISRYFTIVSGWAYGCDTFAHNEAMKSWNKTISVIWTAINEDYPVWNKKMYDEIITAWGAIISIFPLGVPWSSFNFPVRNEIVAGLSAWTVVIEAREKSGSLITAKLTLDLGKDLFAIPWEIFKPNSAWCNNLIKAGEAKAVLSCFDILEEYNFSNNLWKKRGVKKEKIVLSDEIEQDIYNLLLLEWFTIDELIKKLKLDITAINFKISMLEINGLIKKTLWWKYEIN